MPYSPTTDPPRNELATAYAHAQAAERTLAVMRNLLDMLSRRNPLQANATHWEEVADLCERTHNLVAQAENEFVMAMGAMMIGDAPQAGQPSSALEQARRWAGRL